MIKRIFASFALATLCASSAGCGGEGDCEKAVGHIVTLIEQDLEAQDQAAAKPDKAALIEKCKQDGLTAKQEKCVLAAKSLTDLNKCDRR